MRVYAWLKRCIVAREKISNHPEPVLDDALVKRLRRVCTNTDVDALVQDTVFKRSLVRVYHESVHDLIAEICNERAGPRDHRLCAVSLSRYFAGTLTPTFYLERLCVAMETSPKRSSRIQFDIEALIMILNQDNRDENEQLR
jgi:hypothetical protein